MRRLLTTAVAVPIFALAACGGEEDPQVQEPGGDSSPTNEAAQTSTEASETTTEDMETTTQAEQTSTPDDSSATSAGGPAMGGEEGQAAADRTEEFLIALVNADPALCGTILNLQGNAPMNEAPADLKQCEEQIIPPLAQQMDGLLTEEQAGTINEIEITGAQVDGETATVTPDNFSGSLGQGFAQGLGRDIVLQNIGGEWYVDFQQTFLGS